MAISTAFSSSRRARGLAIKTVFEDRREGNIQVKPQQIAIVGQGSTGTTYDDAPYLITSSPDAGKKYGFGSPIHLAAMQIFPDFGESAGSVPVTVYPLTDAGSGVAATGTITITGTPVGQDTLSLIIGGIDAQEVLITKSEAVDSIAGKIAAAVNAIVEVPVKATASAGVVTLTAKAKGSYGNSIKIVPDINPSNGVTVAITAMKNGAVNPDITTALQKFDQTWESIVVSCFDYDDDVIDDAFETFGKSRWGAEMHRPLVVLSGTTETNLSTLKTYCDDRKDDYVNSVISVPGSPNMDLQIAARAAVKIAVKADSDPAYDYGRLELDGIIAGDKGEQWSSTQRDQMVKFGCSTTELRNGNVCLSDVVTMEHPDGVLDPEKRHVVDIMKLMTIIHNFNLEFDGSDWDGAPLIPDDQPTTNPNAKKPKMVRAEAAKILDSLGLNAIISDPTTAKSMIQVEIDSQNPKRWNLYCPLQLSGNSNVKSVTIGYGYYYGTPQVLA